MSAVRRLLISYQNYYHYFSYPIHRGERKFKHCGLFGDPHLRTFSDEFQTCKVEGAWPLIDNDYLVVQVTNAIVVHKSSATATSKVGRFKVQNSLFTARPQFFLLTISSIARCRTARSLITIFIYYRRISDIAKKRNKEKLF